MSPESQAAVNDWMILTSKSKQRTTAKWRGLRVGEHDSIRWTTTQTAKGLKSLRYTQDIRSASSSSAGILSDHYRVEDRALEPGFAKIIDGIDG